MALEDTGEKASIEPVPHPRGSSRSARVARALREGLLVGVPAVLTLPLTGSPDAWTTALQQVAAVLAVPLLLVRRRAPFAVVAVVAVLLGAGLDLQCPAVVALASLAARSSWPRAAAGALLLLAGYASNLVVGSAEPSFAVLTDGGGWILLIGAVLVLAAAAAAGLYVGARRQLLVSVQARAERAEAEQELLAERARIRERARIAREMHDVLAHRLSMLALHAGALEYRAEREELSQAAGVIRENAHQALQELRDVLGVLRAESDEVEQEGDDERGDRRPQPSLADVEALVAEARAGAEVVLHREGPLDAVPAPVGRAGYRIVQEGLTNARRHAPGAAVAVTVAAEEASLTIEVRNAAPPRAAAPSTLQGGGSGLVGVEERAALLGGRASHGPTSGGGFVLRVELPVAGEVRDDAVAGVAAGTAER